jgi:beta-glucosidase-like glycosyl hydrolase
MYARKILAEHHVAPIHKGRALFRLSQFAFNKNNRELYDSIYNELKALKASDGIGTIEPVVEVNYNIINGHRASENKDLLTGILREEWGFDGMVTTDWWTLGEHYKEVAAGNDMKMATGFPERLLEAMKKGVLTRGEMEKAAENILQLILRID